MKKEVEILKRLIDKEKDSYFVKKFPFMYMDDYIKSLEKLLSDFEKELLDE